MRYSTMSNQILLNEKTERYFELINNINKELNKIFQKIIDLTWENMNELEIIGSKPYSCSDPFCNKTHYRDLKINNGEIKDIIGIYFKNEFDEFDVEFIQEVIKNNQGFLSEKYFFEIISTFTDDYDDQLKMVAHFIKLNLKNERFRKYIIEHFFEDLKPMEYLKKINFGSKQINIRIHEKINNYHKEYKHVVYNFILKKLNMYYIE